MEIEQKANKVIRPASIYTLSAEETNQITTELQNVITAGGLTPSNSTLTQVRDAIDNLISDATTGEWQKPADWVDIRSGALPNSIYFLAAHKADFSAYNEFGVMAHINNTGDTYDVYVDGIKYQTVSGNYGYFSINWQNANLSSGYDVTYPQALRTHIVRITPTDPTKHFYRVSLGGNDGAINTIHRKSVLWLHCNLNYSLNCTMLSGTTIVKMSDSLLEAITSNDGVLKCSDITQMIAGQCNLRTIPILDLSDTNEEIPYFAYRADAQYLNKIHIRNLHQTGDKNNYSVFTGTQVKEIVLENSEMCWGAWTFDAYCSKLKKIPAGLYHPTNNQQLSLGNFSPNLEDTFLDLSSRTGLTRLNITGQNNNRIDGLKGITVSPSAPFTEATSPQINIPKTGLDRAALVNLFKSMPYNVGYTVVGSPTITDGVASGFSENDYSTLPITLDFNNDFEFSVKISVVSVARFQYIFGISNASKSSGGLKFDIGSSRVQAQVGGLTSLQLNQRLSAGNIYIIKWKRTANTGYLGLFNQEGTLIDETSVADYGTAPTVSSFTIGVPAVENKDVYLAGSIDLNNTYIKVNGVPWFTGKAAMTKTCNIVGCTGTADLTAEDKAIATDKGWALTLS